MKTQGKLFTPKQRHTIETHAQQHEAPEVCRKLELLLLIDDGHSYVTVAQQERISRRAVERLVRKVIRNGRLVPGSIESLRNKSGRPVSRKGNPINKRVGQYLKRKRLSRGMTQEEVAELGFPGGQGNLSEKENGHTALTIDQLAFLTRAYQLTPQNLYELVLFCLDKPGNV